MPDPDDLKARTFSTGPPGPVRLTPLREAQLVKEHLAGDPEAAAELLAGYQRRIYAVCFRMVHHVEEARDLAQESLVKVLEGLPSYDGRSKLSTWVIRVTMNCCLSHLRKAKLRRHQSLDSPADPRMSSAGGGFSGPLRASASGELSGMEHVEQMQKRAAVVRALARLDPEMRAILVLRDVQDMDYQQIALVIDSPVGTVKSRLFRARLALREAVEEELGEKDS